MFGYVARKRQPAVQLPLTALIDIVFLLLVYFLLTTNFLVEEGIKIKLPQARASAPQTEKVITVVVDRDGRAFLGTEAVDIPRLFDRLRTLIGADGNKLVVVRADRTVVLNKAVRIMDVAKAAGAGRLCLATEKAF